MSKTIDKLLFLWYDIVSVGGIMDLVISEELEIKQTNERRLEWRIHCLDKDLKLTKKNKENLPRYNRNPDNSWKLWREEHKIVCDEKRRIDTFKLKKLLIKNNEK